ncbi:MAG: FkbM family methyltransferase [Candidatus Methanomethylicaceae archaeon]
MFSYEIMKRLAYCEYVFFRVFSRMLLGKRKRDELIIKGKLNFDQIMSKHFMNRFTGFIKPLNKREAFTFYDGFYYVIPLDDTGILEEVKKVYIKPKENYIVIDIGAHYGFYTVYVSRIVGTNGLILSFEPHPNNYKRLLMNLRLNDVSNVKTFNIALGEFNGKTRLYIHSLSVGHSIHFKSKDYVTVELVKLDTIVERLNLKKVDLIKIDVEGAELDVLKGASNVIERFKPSLTIAAYHFPEEIVKLEEWLKKKNPNYVIIKTKDNFLHAVNSKLKIN